MVPGPPLARSGRTTLRPTTSLALRSRKQLIPRDFSSRAWSRKPQRGPEANFVEPIEDRKHDRKRQNSRDYESAIESAFHRLPACRTRRDVAAELQRECGVQDLGDSRPLVAGKMGLQNRSDFSAGRKPETRARRSGPSGGGNELVLRTYPCRDCHLTCPDGIAPITPVSPRRSSRPWPTCRCR